MTSLSDVTATDELVTLREAIQAANTDSSVDGSTAGSGADTIVFDSSLFTYGNGTVQLSQFDTGLDAGEVGPTAFTISTEMTILGPSVASPRGANGVTISRNSPSHFRLFTVTGAGNLTLDSLTIANGAAFGFNGGNALGVSDFYGNNGYFGGGGGGGSAGFGGAVFVQKNGILAVRNSLLTGNVAQGGNGGSYSYSTAGGGGGGAGLGANGATGSSNQSGVVSGGGPFGTPQGSSRPAPNDPFGIPQDPRSPAFRDPFGRPQNSGGPAYGGGGSGGNAGSGGFGAGGGGGAMGQAGGNGGFGGGAGQPGSNNNPHGRGPSSLWNGQRGFGGGVAFYFSGGGFGGGGAGMGGAVFSNGGTVTISNSTLTGNSAIGGGRYLVSRGGGFGGAVFALNGSLSILSSTITGNTAVGTSSGSNRGAGRGVYVRGDVSYAPRLATVVLSNSLIAQGDTNQTDVVVNGAVNSSGSGNLVGSSSGLTSGMVVSTANPMLSPLVDNGGPTNTFALLAGSPALDAGVNAAAAGLTNDQRGSGFARILNGTIDIGAVEGVYVNPPLALNNTVSTVQNFPRSFEAADFPFTDPQNDPLASITITGQNLAAGDTLTFDPGTGPLVVTNGMTIAVAQLPGLVYTPANNQFNPARSSFQFTANGANPAYGVVSGTVTINVNMAPTAPTAIALSGTTVGDRQPIGLLVGDFQSTSTDPNNTFTYSLVPGTGDDFNWAFSIAGDLLLTAASFDMRYITSLPIRVRTTDANSYYFEQQFTVSVTTLQPAMTYRAYNPTTDAHFFTTNQTEFQNAIQNGFLDETDDDSGFQLLNAPAANATAVYRLYNILTGQHYYTTNPTERDFLVALLPPPASGPDTRILGWRNEGINGYLFASQQPNTVPIFQLYNANSGTHLYTESTAMRDAILAIPGTRGGTGPWSLQGILGYAFPAGFNGQPSTPPVGQSARSAAAVPVTPQSSQPVSAPQTTVTAESQTSSVVNVGLIVDSRHAPVPAPHAAFSGTVSTLPPTLRSPSDQMVPIEFALDLALQTWTDELTPQ